MITRWEIRENTVTSGSVYILALVGEAGDVAFIEKELYFFCRLVNVTMPPFTHIFELTNISDDDMLEKIRVKMEECINETANNATAVFSADHLGKDLNLDVISPETQVFPMEFQQEKAAPQKQSIKPLENTPKPVPARAQPAPKPKHDIFAAEPGPSLHIAEATRYQEEPPTSKTNSRLSLAKDGLSFDKEADAFEGGIQLENELDIGDGTFISLDTASAKKLQEVTDFNPNAGLSGLLKGAKLEPLNTQSSGDTRNISSDGVKGVTNTTQTSSGGNILNKIFKKFSGSGKKASETEVATFSKPAAQPVQQQQTQSFSKPAPMPSKPLATEDKTKSRTSITEAADEVFKEKKSASQRNIVVTPDEATPDVFKRTEVRQDKFSNLAKNMQGPLEEQTSSQANSSLEGNIPVDDIFAAETICDFYANSEQFSSTKSATMPKQEVEAILSAKPSASSMDDDFTNIPNLLGPAVKIPAKVKKQEPVPVETDASPLGNLLGTPVPTPVIEKNNKKEVKPLPSAVPVAAPKEKEIEPVKISVTDNIVLTGAESEQFKLTPAPETLARNAAVSHVAKAVSGDGEEPVYEAPTEGFFGTGDFSPAQHTSVTEASKIADIHGFTGVLATPNPQNQAAPAPIVSAQPKQAPVVPKLQNPVFIKPSAQVVKAPLPASAAALKAPAVPHSAPARPVPPPPPGPFLKTQNKTAATPPLPQQKGASVAPVQAVPAGLSQQKHKNMVELSKVSQSPAAPALRHHAHPVPPPPPNIMQRPKVAQGITAKQTAAQHILRGNEKNMTQEDLNKIKNLAKPEPKEDEPSAPAKVPPQQPLNLKTPQGLPQVPAQRPAPSIVPPAVAPRVNMPQMPRPAIVNGPVRSAPIARPLGSPAPVAPQVVPQPVQPALRRPVVNNAQQRPVPAPAAAPVPAPAAHKAAAQEEIAERTKTIDHTIQIPIGQIYKKSNWPLEVPLVPTFTFENMDLASNRFPHAAAMSVIENIGTMYNPFVLYGEGGSGKTHFLNAMGYELSKKISQEKIFITNGVRFARGIQRYVEEGKKDSLDEFFKNAEVLIIDDIHLTAVNEHNREFITKLLNRFLKEKKQIIISSKYPPESLARFEDLVNFRLDQGWVSELKQPRPQHFARIYNKMVQDSEMGLTEAQAQSFFGSSGYTLGEISRYIRNAKVLQRKIKDSNGPARGFDEILSYMLAVSGEDQKSQIVIKSFEDIVSLQRGENMDWGSFGFFFPQDQADKFKWIAYSTMQRAKELGIKGGFNFALKSAYSTEHIISSAFKIANICDNKNLKGAIILGPSSISCTPAIRDNFYDILSHMLEIMMIRCGIVNAEGIKLPSSYVKVLGDVLK